MSSSPPISTTSSGDKKPGSPPPVPKTPAFPSRDDCWSEDATRTLIDEWGSQYLRLNRGSLRQSHWQAVADAVNALHGGAGGQRRRTDVQCKNRIDTAKKKFKIEKSKLVKSAGRHVSTWPHFAALDSLIGGGGGGAAARNLRRRISRSPESSPETRCRSVAPVRKREDLSVPTFPCSVPVGPRSKRSVTERNFSVMAAAAAAMEAQDDDDDEGEWGGARKRKKGEVGGERSEVAEGCGKLAEAIVALGKIYERVEGAKQRQMVELEKQRMQFAKDLEIQRMKVFMESQVRMERLKRDSTREDVYWYF